MERTTAYERNKASARMISDRAHSCVCWEQEQDAPPQSRPAAQMRPPHPGFPRPDLRGPLLRWLPARVPAIHRRQKRASLNLRRSPSSKRTLSHPQAEGPTGPAGVTDPGALLRAPKPGPPSPVSRASLPLLCTLSAGKTEKLRSSKLERAQRPPPPPPPPQPTHSGTDDSAPAPCLRLQGGGGGGAASSRPADDESGAQKRQKCRPAGTCGAGLPARVPGRVWARLPASLPAPAAPRAPPRPGLCGTGPEPRARSRGKLTSAHTQPRNLHGGSPAPQTAPLVFRRERRAGKDAAVSGSFGGGGWGRGLGSPAWKATPNRDGGIRAPSPATSWGAQAGRQAARAPPATARGASAAAPVPGSAGRRRTCA